MPILRDMLWHGPLRYQDLADLNPGISPTVLAGRLRELTADGLIEKLQPGGRRSGVYRLTERGRCIEPVVDALYQFGIDMLTTEPLTPRRIAYVLMLATRSRDAAIWDLHDHMVRLEIADLAVVIELQPGAVAVIDPDSPFDTRVRMSQATFVELIAGAEPTSPIDINGDHHAADEFLAVLRRASQRSSSPTG